MSFLEDWRKLKLLIFGGKGGVGKTTLASAASISLARVDPDRKILLLSTDPAHSLSDSFGIEIGDKETPIYPDLFARELDALKLADVFKEKHSAVLKTLAERGTYFDRQDIENFFSLSLPGLDEVMAIIEVANILQTGIYDMVILDTAPTGHTMRLLSLPENMKKWVEVLDLMQAKHRFLVTHFTGRRYIKDPADLFLERLSGDIDRVKNLLSDPKSTEFVLITIPESMIISETERLLKDLRDLRIPVKNIFINQFIVNGLCPFCTERQRAQSGFLREIKERFSAYYIFEIPLLPREVKGLEDIKKVSQVIEALAYSRKMPVIMPRVWKEIRPAEKVHLKLSLLADKRFVFFGGKGGVGKTSIASSTALYIAMKNSEKRILTFSTDPAHSLSDSFGVGIGDKLTPIDYKTEGGANLFALEMDASRLFDEIKEKYRESIEEVFTRFLLRGVDVKFDRKVMTELFSLAPPGLDEIMSLKTIMDLGAEGKYDLFILDTSPTGHLLRFLELPELTRQWVHSYFKLLIKYKGIVSLSGVAESALQLSESIRKIRETLTNEKETDFVAVTIPEALGVEELARLLGTLKKLGIPCRHILVNKVIPPSDCGFCNIGRTEQLKYIEGLRRDYPDKAVAEVPQFPHDLKGISDLMELAHEMYANAQ